MKRKQRPSKEPTPVELALLAAILAPQSKPRDAFLIAEGWIEGAKKHIKGKKNQSEAKEIKSLSLFENYMTDQNVFPYNLFDEKSPIPFLKTNFPFVTAQDYLETYRVSLKRYRGFEEAINKWLKSEKYDHRKFWDRVSIEKLGETQNAAVSNSDGKLHFVTCKLNGWIFAIPRTILDVFVEYRKVKRSNAVKKGHTARKRPVTSRK